VNILSPGNDLLFPLLVLLPHGDQLGRAERVRKPASVITYQQETVAHNVSLSAVEFHLCTKGIKCETFQSVVGNERYHSSKISFRRQGHIQCSLKIHIYRVQVLLIELTSGHISLDVFI
jgi:hypothetical protein